ncbi:restriction endonuclease subunit S [Neptunomonas marina]|uniref:Restriction endonuclease subunit S n=1 Tax=Neptunomonas marina TaxID=1815562 RepID=A0A437Q465_9GAMM|nr:restriction endonuclease subunit S [Neptunomonas marina]RVU29319.1 restriction endonuclease subunit S [Neptunomonas marina]
MSKYPRYPEYKESGVEWLGSIPNHWQLTKIKHIAELTPKKPDVDRDLKCSFLPMEKLKTDMLVLDEVRSVRDVYDGYTYFTDHDILMAKVTPCFENKNIAIAEGLINQLGFGSSEIYVLRINPKANNRYLFYRLQEDSFMDIATAAMTGAGGLKRVPSDTVKNFISAFPCVEEQAQIASFLDHETAKIDALIEKQQQLIKLLKEKRQAVISHAVTKGLNPDVPMKNSGVEWFGSIPKSWQLKRLIWITTTINDINHEMPKATDEGVLFLSAKDLLNDGTLNFEKDVKKISNTDYNRLSKKIKPRRNDIIYSRIGAALGKSRLVETDIKFLVSYSCCVIRPIFELVLPKYLNLVLDTDLVLTEAKIKTNGIGVPDLGLKEIGRFPIPLPPIDEQKDILSYLETKLKKMDRLISKSVKSVDLMKERRVALISAAVTGKIDVRNWQPENQPAQANAS